MLQKTNFIFSMSAAFLVGCSAVTGTFDPVIRTSQHSVGLTWNGEFASFSVNAVVVNNGRQTELIGKCGPQTERSDGAHWVVVDMRACGNVEPTWTVPPHDSLVIPVTVADSRDRRTIVRDSGGLIPGTYRMIFSASEPGEPEGRRPITSNEFVVVDDR